MRTQDPFLILLLALTLALGGLAEEFPAETRAFMLTATEVSSGFELISEDYYVVEDISGDVFQFPRQRFSRPAGEDDTDDLTVVYGYATTSDDQLPKMWRSLTEDYFNLGEDTSQLTGSEDILFPAPPSQAFFMKGNALVAVTVRRADQNRVETLETLKMLKGLLLTKVESQGVGSLTPFNLDYDVQTQPSGSLQISGAKTSGEYPFRFSLQMLDLSTEETIRRDPIQLVSESSFSIDIDALPPGSYFVSVLADDVLGRQQNFEYEFVIDEDPTSNNLTLPTTKDSTLVERNKHENEGANSLLTLEKVQGKTTRSAVGFDLDGVNLNGLTSAKLVLTVDPSESVTGWGNGETVTVSAITTPWVEGNGRHFGLNNNQQDDGSGSGTTWFAAIDTNIDNNSSNSASSWNGASVATLSPTAPPLTVTNHFDGQLEFDVTNDILNGNGYEGWLVTKDRENKGSKVSFYSKESGDPTLAPQLILDFGDSTAQAESPTSGVLAKLGFGRGKLESKPAGSELPSLREQLQESPMAAYAGETLVGAMAGPNPALKMASKVAYRAWLEQGLG